jgi:hypothetical protein
MLADLERLGHVPGPLVDLAARQLALYAAQEPGARPLVLRHGAVLLARLGQARHMGPLLARVGLQALEELSGGRRRSPYMAPEGSAEWLMMQQEPLRSIMDSWPGRALQPTELARLMGRQDWAFVDNERPRDPDPTLEERDIDDMAPSRPGAEEQLELLWCLASQRAQHEPAPELVRLLLEGVDAGLEGLVPLRLPRLAAACAALGLRDRAPLRLLAAKELAGRCSELSPSELADLVCGLAELSASPGALLREVADAATAQMGAFRPGEMARLARGFAAFWAARAFPSPPRRLMAALGAAAEGRLAGFRAAELVELLRALAAMGLGEERVVAALVEAAAPRAAELAPRELLAALAALVQLVLCPEDLLAACDQQLAAAWGRQREQRRRAEERRQREEEQASEQGAGEEEGEEEEWWAVEEDEEDEEEEEEQEEGQALEAEDLVACLQQYSQLLYLPQSLEELLQGLLAGALQQAAAAGGAAQLGPQLSAQLVAALQACADLGSPPRQLLAALREHHQLAASLLRHLAPAQAASLAYALVVAKAYDLPLQQQLATELPALLAGPQGGEPPGLGAAALLHLGAVLAVVEAEGGPRVALPAPLAAAAAAALQQHLAEPADPDAVDLAARLAADVSGRVAAVDVPAGPGAVASVDVSLRGYLSVSGRQLALQLLRESEEVLPEFSPSGLAQLGARLLAQQGWEVVHVSALALGAAGPEEARRYMAQALASSGLLL